MYNMRNSKINYPKGRSEMKKNIIRVISMGLCLILCLSGTSCSESSDNADGTADVKNEVVSDTTVEEETADERLSSNLEVKDLDGYSFNIYGPHENGGGDWHVHDMIAEEITGEVINDAIFNRNLWLSQTYNFNITLEESSQEDVYSVVEQFIMAGDTTYSTYAVRAHSGAALSKDGMLLDLYKQDCFDFSQSYWAPSVNDLMSIRGHLYMATGDITVVTREGIRAFYFNKDLLTDYQLESPYELVREGSWTYDKMFDMMTIASTDLDGNGTMDKNDRYGIQTQPILGMVLYQGSGETLISNNSDSWSVTATDERSLSAMLKISELVKENKDCIWSSGDWQNMLKMFENNQALFYTEVMLHIVTMRGFEVDFGIIPTPKFDEAQKNYSHFVDSGCNIFYTMPVTLEDPSTIAYILEALAASSRAEVTPAYYDKCLKHKSARDEESTAMLDIIFSTYHLDIGNVYNFGVYSTVNSCLCDGGDVSSSIAKIQKPTEKMMQKVMSSFESENDWDD